MKNREAIYPDLKVPVSVQGAKLVQFPNPYWPARGANIE